MSTVTAGTAPATTHYAGFRRRFVAYVIDDTIIAVVICLLMFAVSGGSNFAALGDVNFKNMEAAQVNFLGVAWLLQVLAIWLYFALQESSSHGATLGKRCLGLRVTDGSGKSISFARATCRFFSKTLSTITIIGWILAAFTKRKQALHDFVADTLVIKG